MAKKSLLLYMYEHKAGYFGPELHSFGGTPLPRAIVSRPYRNPFRTPIYRYGTYLAPFAAYAANRFGFGRSSAGSSGAGSVRQAARQAVKGVRYGKKFRREVAKAAKKEKPFNKLKKQVKTLSKAQKAGMGQLIYRITEGASQISNANTQGNESFSLNTTTEIETVLGQLRYYDPAAPTTLVTADFTTGSYSKDILIKSSYMKIHVRNNYQTPCVVRAYLLSVKTDGSINPESAWTNGMSDISNGTINQLGIYPTDSPQFNDLFKIDKELTLRLRPGAERTVSVSARNVTYNPSIVDSQTDTNQRACRTRWIMFSVMGVIAHDSSAAQYGAIGVGVDFMVHKTYKVEYNAGADIKYIYLSDGLDAFTNGALVSNAPISDNQGYSLA